MTRLARTPALIAGATGMMLLAALAVVGPLLWGETAEQLGGTANLPASAAHWFGTDALGRDVLARTLTATRLTLLTSLGATAIAAVGGIALGTLIWVSGPRVRELGRRLIDVLVSYPAVILALVVVAVLGPGPGTSVAAIGLASSPAFARLTTTLAASVATRDYVATARLLGVSPLRVLRRHILPNIAEPLLVLVSVAFTVSLKALSGLSFLGLGAQPPSYDWGRLLATGLEGIYTNPAPALGPALAIVLAGLAGGLLGDGLAAATNPVERQRITKSAVPTTTPAAPQPGGVVAARVAGLSVRRADGTPIVADVSFEIGIGEIVGLVGESGSGKSLTAMALAQLLPEGLVRRADTLSAGDLDLTGTPEPRRLATEIGIIYQDPSAAFNPTLRVGGQLTETVRVHGRLPRSKAVGAAVERLRAARVSWPEQRMRQHPHELSGGMRQRAMIASALLTEPRLIIADEPTTALDVTVQAEVLRLLQEANSTDGTAILLISHDIGVISSVCDRVLVMYAGRLVEELPVEAVRAGRAEHPYTRALLAATPRLHRPVDEPLAPIPGRPPEPAHWPAGCAFAPRCELARDRCREVRPALQPTGAGGAAACHALDWTSVGSGS